MKMTTPVLKRELQGVIVSNKQLLGSFNSLSNKNKLSIISALGIGEEEFKSSIESYIETLNWYLSKIKEV